MQLFKKGQPSHFVDAEEKTASNWMRYVNSAYTEEEKNLVAVQFDGNIYYWAVKNISPGATVML